jgi:hypothetical protein
MNDNQQLSAAPEAMSLNTGLSIFDTGTFESIWRVADAMAHSPLVPESLRTKKVDGKVIELPVEQVRANCFLVCEQAARWTISPFAALGCASNIYGRLMWEGKLVAGVLDAKLGVKLNYEYSGKGANMTVIVSGTLPGEDKPRTVSGSVADWKTDQWKESAFEQRLSYRGAREWARRHAPAVLLGVYTEDEFDNSTMRDVTPKSGGLRETHINPFENMQAAEPLPLKVEQATPAPAATSEAAPEVASEEPAKAKREKKERIVCDAKFRTITPKEGKGKNFWVVGILIKGQYREVTTFSTTMATDLGWLEENADIKITVVPSADGKSNQLEAFEVIKPEGSLI